MTGYENKWVDYYTDPDEKEPRVFDPDRPVWDDDDDFYDEDAYEEDRNDG